MSKFNLVLADLDEEYIDSLNKYIRSRYASKFNIYVFTSKASLAGFLADSGTKPDILLACPEILPEEIQNIDASAVLILTASAVPEQKPVFPYVYKYQPGELILNRIIEAGSYAGSHMGEILKGNKGAYVISVYSPIGGSGKTVISFYLSLLLSRMGFRLFFLSLESPGSAGYLMSSDENTGHAMSDLLFYVQKDDENLAVRINALKSTDERYNIDYLCSSGSSYDLDETTGGDMQRLIGEIRQMDRYDIILADTGSAFGRLNMSVLDCSDSIILVALQNPLAQQKLTSFENELKRVEPESWQNFFRKFIPVTNMYDASLTVGEPFSDEGRKSFIIPCLADIYSVENGKLTLNPNSSIAAHLGNAVSDLLPDIYSRLSGKAG